MKNLLLFFFSLILVGACYFLVAAPVESNTAYVLTLKGAISPATQEYINKGLKHAAQSGRLVIIELDTPGGLLGSTRDMAQSILNSPIPVITYVAPSGAHAASAGTFLLYASSVAAMAPGTNVGAASPIALGGGNDKNAKVDVGLTKAQNDSVAWIKSLADLHGRNAIWGEQSIMQAASLSADDAVKQKVVDVVANNIPDLLQQVDNRMVIVDGKPQMLHTKDLTLITLAPDLRQQILAVLAEPTVAYVLLLIAIYGILFEFLNPGMVAPGVIGVIAALLAVYGLHVLPINFAGLALIFIGIILMVVELFVASFGMLGLGGIIAFFAGSLFLFDRSLPGLHVVWSIAAAFTVVTAIFFLIILRVALRAFRGPVITGKEGMINAVAEVVSINGDLLLVRVDGELWRATCKKPVEVGSKVRIISENGLELRVSKIEE